MFFSILRTVLIAVALGALSGGAVAENSKNLSSQIVVGYQHVCLIRQKDGAVLCVGDNKFGQVGNGTTNPEWGFSRQHLYLNPRSR